MVSLAASGWVSKTRYVFLTVVVVEIWNNPFGSDSDGYRDCQRRGSVGVTGFGQL